MQAVSPAMKDGDSAKVILRAAVLRLKAAVPIAAAFLPSAQQVREWLEHECQLQMPPCCIVKAEGTLCKQLSQASLSCGSILLS